MPRKKQERPVFDAAGLKWLQAKLETRNETLVRRMSVILGCGLSKITFDDAVDVRDMGQSLTVVCMVMGNIPELIRLVELSGEPQAVPFLGDCGLDEDKELET